MHQGETVIHRMLPLGAGFLVLTALSCASEVVPGPDSSAAQIADSTGTTGKPGDAVAGEDGKKGKGGDAPPPFDRMIMGENGPGGGPMPCETDADCLGAGCIGRAGCTCFDTPDGKLCVPLCKTDDDCPAPPDQELVCSPDGKCQPKDLQTTGPSCKTDADCLQGCQSAAGCKCSPGGSCAPVEVDESKCSVTADCAAACPPNAKACECINPPGLCVPTCTTATDCPAQTGQTIDCVNGHCEPKK